MSNPTPAPETAEYYRGAIAAMEELMYDVIGTGSWKASVKRVTESYRAQLSAITPPAIASGTGDFQSRVKPWMDACFGEEISADRKERNHRFIEEALELVQACGGTKQECLALVEYVFNRPTGEPTQEVGGIMVTLAALCLANGFDMHANGETELTRVWGKIEQIRAKQAAKPKHSVLTITTGDVAIVPEAEVAGPTWELMEKVLRDGLSSFDGCEINPSNYGDCAVSQLNDGYVGLFQTIESALAIIAQAKEAGR